VNPSRRGASSCGSSPRSPCSCSRRSLP
jgi:hypothetical protein